jgi:hypothetical protein
MKVAYLTICSIACALLLFLSSCSSTKKMETKMIGNWIPVKVENITPVVKAPNDTTPDGSLSRLPDSIPAGQLGKNAARIERLVQNERRGSLKIYIKDKKRIVERIVPGKTVTGTWKLKKQGKRILMKETGGMERKMLMDLVSVTDSTAQVITKIPEAELLMRIKYRKAPK